MVMETIWCPIRGAYKRLLHYLLRLVDDHESHSANAKSQVNGRANQGQAEIVPNAGVDLPASFDLLCPEQK